MDSPSETTRLSIAESGALDEILPIDQTAGSKQHRHEDGPAASEKTPPLI
jgi:hypothetical protein